MSFKHEIGRAKGILIALIAAIVGLALVAPAGAQQEPDLPEQANRASPHQPGDVVEPTMVIDVDPPKIRGALEDESVTGFFGDLAPGEAPPRPELDVPPFRPTLPENAYRALKVEALERAAEATRPQTNASDALGPPSQIGSGKNFDGLDSTESGNLRPPDTHGAQGLNHFTQVVNSATAGWKKQGVGKIQQFSRSLASHFGYTQQTIFDPRVIYDPVWDRWVWIAEAFAESSTVQRQFIAVSRTPRPHGSYCVYSIDINVFNNDDFWDFPTLGFTQDAIMITANIFGPEGYRDTRMLSIAKARLYNCKGFSVPLFTGLDGTLQPPIVLDQNPSAHFAAATPVNSHIDIWRGDNLENAFFATMTKLADVPVTSYSVPPDATQPGTSNTLDTSDSRFVNASTQLGTSLFNVHTVDDFSLPTPRWYEIRTTDSTVLQQGNFFGSGNSNDFNASIAVSATSHAFVTWSSTDADDGINAQARFGGREPGDTVNVMSVNPNALVTSPTFYNPSTATNERWGDYSAVTIDPSPPANCSNRRAWVTNEWIETQSVWGSWVSRIGYC